jgi:hypothetical protein
MFVPIGGRSHHKAPLPRLSLNWFVLTRLRGSCFERGASLYLSKIGGLELMLEASVDRARVLIVDDEPDIREILFDLLSFDYHCAAVSSAEEAIDQLSAQKLIWLSATSRWAG